MLKPPRGSWQSSTGKRVGKRASLLKTSCLGWNSLPLDFDTCCLLSNRGVWEEERRALAIACKKVERVPVNSSIRKAIPAIGRSMAMNIQLLAIDGSLASANAYSSNYQVPLEVFTQILWEACPIRGVLCRSCRNLSTTHLDRSNCKIFVPEDLSE
jgi:hypothetical protein